MIVTLLRSVGTISRETLATRPWAAGPDVPTPDAQMIGETEFSLGELRVRTQFLNHTAPCLGYRVELGGTALVYATDHEPHGMPLWRSDRPSGSFG